MKSGSEHKADEHSPSATAAVPVLRGKARLFDYADLPSEHVAGARACAEWVRGTLAKLESDTIETMTVIGLRLLEAKVAVPHGGFMKWIEQECGLSQTNANRAMSLAETFGLDQIRQVTNLPKTLIYDVVAKGTPEEVRAAFKAALASGEPIDAKAFASRIDSEKHKVKMAKVRISRRRGKATVKAIADQVAKDDREQQRATRQRARQDELLADFASAFAALVVSPEANRLRDAFAAAKASELSSWEMQAAMTKALEASLPR